ncbi:MAG: hypothetical protein ABH803_02090 [Candidatus Micrarchaeota archaeon]
MKKTIAITIAVLIILIWGAVIINQPSSIPGNLKPAPPLTSNQNLGITIGSILSLVMISWLYTKKSVTQFKAKQAS